MPRPEKDYGLALRKDIEKLGRAMQSLHDKRLRLINAFEAYTGARFEDGGDNGKDDKTKKKPRSSGSRGRTANAAH